MKKLLLSLVVSAAALSASAESAVFDFANPDAFGYTSDKRETGVDYNKPLVSGDVTITCDTKTAATGGGMLRFWWPKDPTVATDFRCSAKGGKLGQTLTFTANGGTITKIEFSAAKFALTADPGTLGAFADKVATWEGDAKSVVFTTTDACTFNKITVTYSLGAAADLKPAGLAWSETAVTVTDDKIADFVAPALTNPNNLTVTYSSSDENVAEVSETGVVTLTGDTGTATIKAAFAGDDTYRAGEASYTITVKAAPKTVASVAETVKLADNTEFVVGYELTVAYVNGITVFAYTSTGEFMQLYGTNSYKEGDVIAAGWTGQYAPYVGTPEIKPVGEFPVAASNTGKAFEAKEVEVANINADIVNHVILVKNVVLADATPATKTNFNGKVGETSILLRNNYGLASVAAGTYNITAVIQVYNTDVQVCPIAYELVSGGETPEPEVVTVKNLKEAFALETGSEVIVDFPLTVGFVNGKNIFVCDEAGDFIQIYYENTVEIGDIIPGGWAATYTLRYDVPQFGPKEALPAVTAGTFTPAVVAAVDVTKNIVNHVIVVKNVVIAEPTPGSDVTDNNAKNFIGKVGDVTLNFRNNYKLESVQAGTYDIELWVNLYNGEPSLYVINFAKVESSGIEDIEVEAGEAVYYNLQGVEVTNPENGIYIVRRGNKVTKEVIR